MSGPNWPGYYRYPNEPITIAADNRIRDIGKYVFKFHVNHLPAEDSHEISRFICCFDKSEKKRKISSAADSRWHLMG